MVYFTIIAIIVWLIRKAYYASLQAPPYWMDDPQYKTDKDLVNRGLMSQSTLDHNVLKGKYSNGREYFYKESKNARQQRQIFEMKAQREKFLEEKRKREGRM